MCYGSVKKQAEKFVAGFYKVIPRMYLDSFTSEELEKLICGKPTIDLRNWRMHTMYDSQSKESQRVIYWFWKLMSEYTQDELANVLQFCTGTGRVPIQGFSALESNRGVVAKFTIRFIPYSVATPYPQAHTCFNRLMLPLYPSFESLSHGLNFIAKNEITGFGID